MKVKILCIVVIAAIVLFGCKKISSDEQAIVTDNVVNQKAQDWFQKQNNQADVALISNASTLKLNDGVPEWDRTKSFVTAKMLITPMPAGDAAKRSNTSKYLVMQQNAAGDIESGYYCFVLSKDNKPDATPSLLAGNTISAHFTGAIIKYGVNGNLITATHYDNGKVANKEDKLAVKPMNPQNDGGNTQSLAPINCNGPQVCTDWYWQTWVNGVLIYEEYLFTSCACENPGGGGVGGNNNNGPCGVTGEQADAIFANISLATFESRIYSTSGTQYTAANGVVRWPRNSAWQFLDLTLFPGYVPQYTAFFTGVLYKKNAAAPNWKWESFAYSNTTHTAGEIPGCFEANVNVTVSTTIDGDGLHAKAQLSGTAEAKMTCMLGVKLGIFTINPMNCSFKAPASPLDP